MYDLGGYLAKKRSYQHFEAEHGKIQDEDMRSLLKALYEEANYESLTDVAFERLHKWVKEKS